MTAKSIQWYGNGTLKSATTLFANNYLLNDEMSPSVFILTLDRLKKTYNRMLRELNESSTSPLHPKRVLRYFEESAMIAFEEEFLSFKIKGCHFHMTQALRRKIQELGLATEYKENSQLQSLLEFF